jgi:hypothetical protein
MFHVIHSRRMPKYQTGTSLEAEVMARNRFFRVRTVRP